MAEMNDLSVSSDPDQLFQDALLNLVRSDCSSAALADFLTTQGRGHVAFMIGRAAVLRADVAPPQFAVAFLNVSISPDGGFPNTQSFEAALSQLQNHHMRQL